MAQRQTLPVLPLRGTVIFPGLTAPIAAGRPGTLRAIEAALKGDRLVFAVAQRDNTDEPTPDILYSMGVIARIGQIQRGLGGVQLLLQGEQRATALQYTTVDNYLAAVVQPVEEQKPLSEDDPAFVALYKEIRERAAELGERRGLPEEVVHQVLDAVTDPGRFSDLVAGYIELPVAERQGLLENMNVEDRLRRVLVHVQRQIGMIEMQEEIKSQVQEELGERQREMYLREQMKAIQKELGDDDQSKEISELREKLDKLELPPSARTEVERELGRLERAGRIRHHGPGRVRGIRIVPAVNVYHLQGDGFPWVKAIPADHGRRARRIIVPIRRDRGRCRGAAILNHDVVLIVNHQRH